MWLWDYCWDDGEEGVGVGVLVLENKDMFDSNFEGWVV